MEILLFHYEKQSKLTSHALGWQKLSFFFLFPDCCANIIFQGWKVLNWIASFSVFIYIYFVFLGKIRRIFFLFPQKWENYQRKIKSKDILCECFCFILFCVENQDKFPWKFWKTKKNCFLFWFEGTLSNVTERKIIKIYQEFPIIKFSVSFLLYFLPDAIAEPL